MGIEKLKKEFDSCIILLWTNLRCMDRGIMLFFHKSHLSV